MTDVKLLVVHSNTRNHLTVLKEKTKELRLVYKCCQQNVFANHMYLIYMYK